jgi:hypothetical protein
MQNPMVGEVEGQSTPPKKNNNTLIIAIAIVIGLGFFGYVVQSGNNSEPVLRDAIVDTTPAPAPEPEVSYEELAEQVFVDVIREEYPESYDVSDRELLEVGYSACEVLDSGVTLDEFLYMLVEEYYYDDYIREFSGAIIGTALGSLCPEHAWMLD